MNKSGILRKWADKYGITIKVQRFDYAPSLDAFVAKNIDACTMTNMEALDMPAASGVPTTGILIGDYSNGNDALLVRNGLQMKDLPGKKLLLVEKTVSEYLFDRAMTINGLRDQIKKVRLINTSDSDIATAFISDTSASAVVTWKPMVSQILKQKGITSLFNSSQIPGEILDLTVVRTDVLNRPDGSGRSSPRRWPAPGTRCWRRCRRRARRPTRCWRPSPKARRTRWSPTRNSSAPPRCSTRRNRRWTSARRPI